ncbi:glycosyl transferase, partial [Candidatus Roizmanbacteria bacterium RIFCSPLOWO2_01_FULL_41_22]
MKYSLIFPVYNEEKNLHSLYQRVNQLTETSFSDCELIFVNDGSFDKTADKLKELHIQDRRIKIINFSRNFGHQIAVTAGLNFAQGEIVAVLDADLQDPPEILPECFEKIKQGYDVVYAIRKNRKEGLVKKIAYSLFYRLLRTMANINIPLDSGDFCVMRRPVVEAINSLPERNRFVRGLRSWVGYKQVGIEYERAGRYAGESKYKFSQLMKLAFDGIFSFSYL